MSKRHEQLLFHYSSALERGDFEMVAEVLRAAERDPVLEQMILDLNDAYSAESPNHVPVKEPPMTTILYPARPRSEVRWQSLPLIAAVVVIALLVVLLMAQMRSNSLPNANPNGTPLAVAQNQAICQATTLAPINVTTLPGTAGVIIGSIPAGQVVTVLERVDFSTVWYYVNTPALQGWITIEALDTRRCNEATLPIPTPTIISNSSALATPYPTALAQSDMAWSCSALTNAAIDLRSRPSSYEYGIVTGSLPRDSIVDVLDYNVVVDSQKNKILWYYVKVGQVQGWMPTYLLDASSCPPIPDMVVVQNATQTVLSSGGVEAGTLVPVTSICEGVMLTQADVHSRPQDNSIVFGMVATGAAVTVQDQQMTGDRTGDGVVHWFFIREQVIQGWVHADAVSGEGCPQASVAEQPTIGFTPVPSPTLTPTTALPKGVVANDGHLYRAYTIQQGDTLLYIIQQPPFNYHTLTQALVNEILSVNPAMISIDHLPPVGSTILLPLLSPTPTPGPTNADATGTALAAPLHATALPADMVSSAGHLYRVYTVQKSDTIVWIMMAFDIDQSELPDVLRINHISEDDILQPGTLIFLPADNLNRTSAATPPPANVEATALPLTVTPINLQPLVTVVATGIPSGGISAMQNLPTCTVVTPKALDVLAAPSRDARVVEILPAGTQVEIIAPTQAADGLWLWVSAHDPLGYTINGFTPPNTLDVPGGCAYVVLESAVTAESTETVAVTPTLTPSR
ncbi:MAG TPA: LysM peptidoglycan-binding domain-containing protein [Phototrophicaceae bacterium]|nr:LysM peptidoglycan-binding domain-containing protein [Phototrophicaceae bacterium]